MKLSDQERISMMNAVYGTATSEPHAPIWRNHLGYAEGVESLGENLIALDAQLQAALGNPGATSAKEQARLNLCAIVMEVVGGTKACSAVAQDPELLAKVSFTASTVCAGKVSEVSARCKNIHKVATENADALVKYGITPGKLTKLDKAIKAFDKVKTAPRQHWVIKSAAVKLIPVLVQSGMAIVRDQLDEMMPQFKEAYPTFYEEYFKARVIVSNRKRRRSKAEQKKDANPASDNDKSAESKVTPLPSTKPDATPKATADSAETKAAAATPTTPPGSKVA